MIRQNWHVLPHEQLIQLLGWDRARYEFTLKEDDFLWSKLGLGVKPRCEWQRYEEPSADEAKRAAEIRRITHDFLGATFVKRGEPPFHFITELSSTQPVSRGKPNTRPSASEITLQGCYGFGPRSAAGTSTRPELARLFAGHVR